MSTQRRVLEPSSSSTDSQPALAGTLLRALVAMRDGDFSVRLPEDWVGLDGKVADTFNDIISANARIAGELERVGHVVGQQGKTRQRVKFGRQQGAWGQMETSVNMLIDDLLWPTADGSGHRPRPGSPHRGVAPCRGVGA